MLIAEVVTRVGKTVDVVVVLTICVACVNDNRSPRDSTAARFDLIFISLKKFYFIFYCVKRELVILS